MIPLPPVLLANLRKWRERDGDGAVWVCPSPINRRKSLERAALAAAYTKTGVAPAHTAHSWRHAFATIATNHKSAWQFAAHIQLDHKLDGIMGVYNHATMLDERRQILEWWESSLIAARDGAKVIPIRAA